MLILTLFSNLIVYRLLIFHYLSFQYLYLYLILGVSITRPLPSFISFAITLISPLLPASVPLALDVTLINDPVDKSVPSLLISIAVPFVSSLALIESIPFVGLVDFDDNLINDPVDKSVPSLLISIAVPSVSLFA